MEIFVFLKHIWVDVFKSMRRDIIYGTLLA